MPSAQATRQAGAPARDDVAGAARAEQRRQLTMELTGTFSIELDVAGGDVTASAALFAAYGLAAPPHGRTTLAALRERIHPDDRAGAAADTERTLHADGPHCSLFRIIRGDNASVRWVEWRERRWTDDSGKAWVLAVGQDVTDRRLAELARDDAEQRARLAVEAAGMHTAEYDDATRTVAMAPDAFAIYGLAPPPDGRISLAAFSARVHPDDLATVAARSEQLLDEGGTDVLTYRIIRADNGETRWVERRRAMVRDVNGRKRFLGLLRDMTAQRLHDMMRRESETRLRLALDTARLFMADADVESGIAQGTPALFRAFGLPQPEDGRFPTQAIRDPLHPEDRDRIIAATERLLRTGGSDSTVLRIIRADDGAERWLERHLTVVDSPDGQRHLVFLGRDITEQRNAELALARSEARLRLAMDSAGLFMIETNPASGRVEMSENAFRLYGLAAPADGVTTLDVLRAHLHPDDRAAVAANTARLAREGGRLVDSLRIVAGGSGEIRWLERHATVLTDAAGKSHVIALLRDVTERRQTERALAESEERLRLAIAAADMFTIEVDVQSGEVLASDRAYAAHGLPLPGAGQPHTDLFRERLHPDDRMTGLITQAELETGGTVTRDARIVRADTGEISWLERHVTLRVGADGRMRRLAIFRDVTGQYRDRIALMESEERLRLAVAAAAMFTIEIDFATGQVIAQDEAFIAHGLPVPRSGMAHIDIFRACHHPEDAARAIADTEALATEDGTRVTVIRIIRPDSGEIRWLERHAAARVGVDGRRRLIGIFRDVTEQRRDRMALAESDARLRLALAAAELFIGEFVAGETHAVFSDNGFTILGLPVPPDRRMALDALRARYHPDERDNARDITRRLVGEGGTEVGVVRMLRADDGTLRWIDRGATAFTDSDGRRRVIVIGRDVTARRRDQIARDESEARLRLAIDAADLFTLEFESDERHVVLSEKAFGLFGLPATPDRKVATDILRERYHPDDRERIMATAARLQRDGGRDVDVVRIMRAGDAAVRWIERGVTGFIDEDGGRRWITVGRDITEQRLDQMARAESEARLRLAIASMGLFTMEISSDESYAQLSEQSFALLGLPETPNGRLPIDTVRSLYHPDDRDRVMATARQLMREGGTNFDVMRVVRVSDGAVRWIERGITAVADADGRLRLVNIGRDITERRRIEEALVTSEHRLRLAMEIKGFATWDQDLDTGQLIWSENLFALLGYAPDPAGIATPAMFWNRIHHDDRAASIAARDVATEGNGDFDIVLRAIRPDGAVRWLEMHARVFHMGGGGRRFIGIVRDITDARVAEAAQEEARERLRLALEAAEEGLWDWDVQADTLWLSERCQIMRGLPPRSGEPNPESWARDLHPEDIDAFRMALRAHLRGDTPGFAAEYRVRHQDGHWLWILDRGKVVRRDAAGRPLRVVGTHQDISRQKEMAEALAAGEARLRALLAAVPESVMIVQRDGKVADINAAGRKLIQAPAHRAPHDIAARDFVAPTDQGDWLVNHTRVCAGSTVRWEYDLIGLSGRRLRVESQGVPLNMPNGTVAHLSVSRDVTVRRAAETRLRKLQAEAMRAARVSAMGAMAAGLAHELNQPLSAAVNYASAAAMLLASATPETTDAPTLARARETIDRAVQQAMRVGEIVRRLRDFIGRGDSELGSLSPAMLIEEGCDTVRPYALDRPGGAAAIGICADVSPDLGEVFGDRVQLVQVLTNLIRNAVDATQQQPRAEILVSAARATAGGGVEFAVTDNGPGLSPSAAKRLFEPFASGKPGGMGIGLVISRTIVEAHGGRIWADARREGRGACFRFFIPDADTGA